MAGAYDLSRLRMMNTMPQSSGSGYGIYDTFLSQVLPLVKGGRSGNRLYNRSLTQDERRYKTSEREAEQNFELQRDQLRQLGEMQARREQRDSEPMNVFWDRSQEITPLEKARLGLAEREVSLREKLGGEKSEL